MMKYNADWNEIMEFLIKRAETSPMGFDLSYHFIAGGRFCTSGMKTIENTLSGDSLRRQIITEVRIEQTKQIAEKFKL